MTTTHTYLVRPILGTCKGCDNIVKTLQTQGKHAPPVLLFMCHMERRQSAKTLPPYSKVDGRQSNGHTKYSMEARESCCKGNNTDQQNEEEEREERHGKKLSSGQCVFNRCEVHRYDKMSPLEAASFRGVKKLLAELDPEQSADGHSLPIDIKRRTHTICARFLGGAWKSLPAEQLCITRIKGGMSNMLFLCHLPEHHRPIHVEPDKVLLRVYFNPETETHLVAESVIFTLLSERHLGPKLYGIFSGGRLEEYIPSRPLSCSEIGLSIMARKIAKRLASVHTLVVPIWKEPDYLCDALERWLHQLKFFNSYKSFQVDKKRWTTNDIPATFTCDDLFRELVILRESMSKSSSPVVFCHNDLQEGNILLPKASSGNIRMPSVSDEDMTALANQRLSSFNPATPRLVLIDFEYASYNYRAFDFANHFVEYTIDYDVHDWPHYRIRLEAYPSLDQQREFFDSYLSEMETLLAASSRSSAGIGVAVLADHEQLVEQMIAETRPFVAVSHFFWGVWGLLQVELSPVGFGFAEYGRDRLAQYFATRDDLIAENSD